MSSKSGRVSEKLNLNDDTDKPAPSGTGDFAPLGELHVNEDTKIKIESVETSGGQEHLKK